MTKTTWSRLGKIAATAAFLCMAPAVVKANLVFNPGFETADFTGWTVTGGVANVTCGDVNYPPHSGSCEALFVASTATLRQSVVTVPGASYTFDFWVASEVPGGDPISFSASWNGVVVLSILDQSDPLPYTHESFNVTATGLSTLVSFTGSPSRVDQWQLDDVSVNAPEPGSIALVIMGSAVIAIRLRRRKT